MKASNNFVRLSGHVGKDPRILQFESGKTKAMLALATQESYKNNKGEWVDLTYWHNLVAWGEEALRIADHVRKGSEITVEGKLTTRRYEDKDGSTRYITEVVLQDVHMGQVAERQ
jgi:single-strand DNA-binding protein